MQQMAQDEETLNEVNVIPLADLSLVLLIILMVMSPMVAQSIIQVSAPRAEAAQNQDEVTTPETPVVVSYEPNALKVNGELINNELDYVKKMSTLMGTRKDKTALLTAAPISIHREVVHLMDLTQRHGVKNLVMLKWAAEQITEPEPEAISTPVAAPKMKAAAHSKPVASKKSQPKRGKRK